ncbi:hypothetical protein N7539_009393 [Penicillium diatomitis]|uniref:Efficient mitochondria targeting-associated protein 19 n=1 Tax=Penicillium diatomitis TaxID=2819901 RepID=A0A9W9WKD3_9EURO|nr:uncharacterized protein N7539_009393 [Penicillium diatomitis]KAJ5466664.1 hypothetical protein N7539_009393 [Penicillium diatomitis]
MSRMALPSRKRDLAYLFFFASHIPIIFLVDTVPLQPAWFRSNLSATIREYYIATYRDKFFEEPAPVWFNAFIWMELLYHVPASVWAVWGLMRDQRANHLDLFGPSVLTDHPLIPVHLLVFGVQAFVTSLTCLVDVWSWTDRSMEEKQQITYLYGPYVALGALMALDMVLRLRAQLMPKVKHE